MPPYSQAKRYLHLTTPLGEDKLLLLGFRGEEGISRLFRFELELMAENATTVAFDKLIGQKVSFGLSRGEDVSAREFHGMVVELSQGHRDKEFTAYRMTVAPEIWKLSCKFRSRIFQQIAIPDLLKQILAEFDVSYEIRDHYEPREYVVQYQESDLDFAARLMEEEGIFYFFKFGKGAHKLVVTDSSQAHPDLPSGATVIFDEVKGGTRDDERVTAWRKQQNWGPGKYTLWDHHFQLPHKHLEIEREVLDSVTVGKVAHKLKLAGNADMEIYENPGRYAQRFDGIEKAGGDQKGELQKIFTDNDRTVKLRAQQGEAAMIAIVGQGAHRQFTAGHKFTLTRHFDGNGKYVLTSVAHEAKEADFKSGTGGGGGEGHYENVFSCIPYADPYRFRPARTTRRPMIHGPQSAVVVGPGGEEIFTDKYGRVKVQFHWDREGKNNTESSCWLRVTTSWAGNHWGAIHIPRIGQEVIVSFLDGDPDRPIVTGSVYNADMMPPYKLPADKTQSGIKSRSSKGAGKDNYNEIMFEDLKGSELIRIHAEKDQLIEVENDRTVKVQHDETVTVQGMRKDYVVGDHQHQTDGDMHLTASQDQTEKIGMDYGRKVGMNIQDKAGMNYAMDAGMQVHLKAGMSAVIEAGVGLTIKASGNSIDINAAGVFIKGNLVFINSGAANLSGSGSSPNSPTSPTKQLIDKLQQEESQIAKAAAGAAAAAASAIPKVQQIAEQAAAVATTLVQSVADQAFAAVSNAADQAVNAAEQAGQLGRDAAQQVLSQIDEAVSQAKAGVEDAAKAGEQLVKQAQEAAKEAEKKAQQAAQQAGEAAAQAEKLAAQAVGQAEDAANKTAQQAEQAAADAKKAAAEAQEQAQKAEKQAQQALQDAQKNVQQAVADGQKQIQQATEQVTQQAQQAGEMAQQTAQQIQKQVDQSAKQAAENVGKTAGAAYAQADSAVNQAARDLGSVI